MPKSLITIGVSKLVSLNLHVWCAARHDWSCSNCVRIWLQHPPDKNGSRKNETRGTECARPRRCFFSFFLFRQVFNAITFGVVPIT
jgi:hypothetical protein